MSTEKKPPTLYGHPGIMKSGPRTGQMARSPLMEPVEPTLDELLTQKVSNERLQDLNGLEGRQAAFLWTQGVHERNKADFKLVARSHAERSAIYNELLSVRTALGIHDEIERKAFRVVFSDTKRARTVLIRAESMLKAKQIAEVVESIYRGQRRQDESYAIEYLVMTSDVDTPKPELTLEEAILWALGKD